MFIFLFGCVVGLFLGFIAFASILASGFKLDLSIVTNIAIAFATIVATLIHYDSKNIISKPVNIMEMKKHTYNLVGQ